MSRLALLASACPAVSREGGKRQSVLLGGLCSQKPFPVGVNPARVLASGMLAWHALGMALLFVGASIF
jgi:hypothetical protein